MRVLKIKLPTRILRDLGLPDFLSVVTYIEISQIYQYDRMNFFALYRIQFRSREKADYNRVFSDFFHAQSFQILEIHPPEIFCIMKQRNDSGFWPALLAGSWALLPPVVIDPDVTIFSILTKEDQQLTQIFEQLQAFQSIEIIALSKPDEIIKSIGVGSPQLTLRQREIMMYAIRHGYYDIPRRISTREMAAQFAVTPSAILNHIQKAEKTVMKYVFG